VRCTIIALAGLFACNPSVPESPTYFEDVQPILASRCYRCHGASPLVEELEYFRLDRFVPEDEVREDLWDLRFRVVDLAARGFDPAMPPDFPLTDRQQEILKRWLEDGAPRGERDNSAPEFELVEAPESEVDQELSLVYRASDPDLDGLVIALALEDGDQSVSVASGLGGALRSVELDVGAVFGPADYQLVARIDDGYSADVGGSVVVEELGFVAVDHGEKGTAPTVLVLSPNGGEVLSGVVEVEWTASDPDPSDALSFLAELTVLRSDGSSQPVATLFEGTGQSTAALDTRDFDTNDDQNRLILYGLRVTATDLAGNSRTDLSDATFRFSN